MQGDPQYQLMPFYLKIACYLGITGIIDLIKIITFNNTGLDWVVTAVKKWLNSSINTNWHLVFNNIDNLEIFKSLIFFQILFPDMSF